MYKQVYREGSDARSELSACCPPWWTSQWKHAEMGRGWIKWEAFYIQNIWRIQSQSGHFGETCEWDRHAGSGSRGKQPPFQTDHQPSGNVKDDEAALMVPGCQGSEPMAEDSNGTVQSVLTWAPLESDGWGLKYDESRQTKSYHRCGKELGNWRDSTYRNLRMY